jgi:hypothetical protein
MPVYLEIIGAINDTASLSGNTLLRKLRTKLISRIATRLLPTPKSRSTRRVLDDSSPSSQDGGALEEQEIPEIVERLLQNLFDILQDKVMTILSRTRKY